MLARSFFENSTGLKIQLSSVIELKWLIIDLVIVIKDVKFLFRLRLPEHASL